MQSEAINPRDLPLGHDEACAADLHGVITGRMLGRAGASWLSRAVAGAIRPSRDRPTWDLAHTIAALGVDGPGLIDLALDPSLTDAATLEARFKANAATDAQGLVLTAPRPWRCSWAGLARSLALAEFILTADGFAGFAEMSHLIGTGVLPAAAPDLARSLSQRLAQYRNAHMPIAPVERRFQAIRGYLRDNGMHAGFDDADIVAFWQSAAVEDVMFTTIVEHFITYDRVSVEVGTLSAIGGAQGLDEIENWEDRLEAMTLPQIETTCLRDALTVLSNMTDGPKMLTGAELDGLAVVLSFDPFHASRPLTALRARVFGRIQSGIANRLRRGTGGDNVAARVQCAEADYAAALDGIESISAHLRKCLTIALALRGSDSDVAAEGVQALKRMRRAGFDAPREDVARAIALIDGALATAAEGIEAHRAAVAKLDKATPLTARIQDDRALFAGAFKTIYAEHLLEEVSP